MYIFAYLLGCCKSSRCDKPANRKGIFHRLGFLYSRNTVPCCKEEEKHSDFFIPFSPLSFPISFTNSLQAKHRKFFENAWTKHSQRHEDGLGVGNLHKHLSCCGMT